MALHIYTWLLPNLPHLGITNWPLALAIDSMRHFKVSAIKPPNVFSCRGEVSACQYSLGDRVDHTWQAALLAQCAKPKMVFKPSRRQLVKLLLIVA